MTLKFPFHLEHSPRCDVVREISNDRLDTTAIGVWYAIKTKHPTVLRVRCYIS